ncbi:serine-rich adhesin for platelets-like [Culicoides brevitarsis]|uniref:serine-rich adhesin for platelets-like n=1 Tax=Culicoides brevitarsis TaxID=469753 RepID=UPI00307C5BC8
MASLKTYYFAVLLLANYAESKPHLFIKDGMLHLGIPFYGSGAVADGFNFGATSRNGGTSNFKSRSDLNSKSCPDSGCQTSNAEGGYINIQSSAVMPEVVTSDGKVSGSSSSSYGASHFSSSSSSSSSNSQKEYQGGTGTGSVTTITVTGNYLPPKQGSSSVQQTNFQSSTNSENGSNLSQSGSGNYDNSAVFGFSSNSGSGVNSAKTHSTDSDQNASSAGSTGFSFASSGGQQSKNNAGGAFGASSSSSSNHHVRSIDSQSSFNNAYDGSKHGVSIGSSASSSNSDSYPNYDTTTQSTGYIYASFGGNSGSSLTSTGNSDTQEDSQSQTSSGGNVGTTFTSTYNSQGDSQSSTGSENSGNAAGNFGISFTSSYDGQGNSQTGSGYNGETAGNVGTTFTSTYDGQRNSQTASGYNGESAGNIQSSLNFNTDTNSQGDSSTLFGDSSSLGLIRGGTYYSSADCSSSHASDSTETNQNTNIGVTYNSATDTQSSVDQSSTTNDAQVNSESSIKNHIRSTDNQDASSSNGFSGQANLNLYPNYIYRTQSNENHGTTAGNQDSKITFTSSANTGSDTQTNGGHKIYVSHKPAVYQTNENQGSTGNVGSQFSLSFGTNVQSQANDNSGNDQSTVTRKRVDENEIANESQFSISTSTNSLNSQSNNDQYDGNHKIYINSVSQEQQPAVTVTKTNSDNSQSAQGKVNLVSTSQQTYPNGVFPLSITIHTHSAPPTSSSTVSTSNTGQVLTNNDDANNVDVRFTGNTNHKTGVQGVAKSNTNTQGSILFPGLTFETHNRHGSTANTGDTGIYISESHHKRRPSTTGGVVFSVQPSNTATYGGNVGGNIDTNVAVRHKHRSGAKGTPSLVIPLPIFTPFIRGKVSSKVSSRYDGEEKTGLGLLADTIAQGFNFGISTSSS